MSSITSLILRGMRMPLIALIVVYAVSVLGLVLIPGPNGHHVDFFHAFYFVSYMATTIGFGELPEGFTMVQRGWVLISIYLTVISWLYAIGVILSLLQNPAFKRAVAEQRVARSVRALRRRFFLICGYGDTGSMLIEALTARGRPAVAMDIDPERITSLEFQNYPIFVPGLCADASLPESLKLAGLEHPQCAGLIALTNDDQANLAIAIAGKLLRPLLPVTSRAESHEVEANMASFGTDHIVDPFDSFAQHLAMAIHSPGLWLVHEWLTAVPDSTLVEPLYPPRGMWVICGYGRFGKAVNANLRRQGVETVIIEAAPQMTGCTDCVVGSGTEARTLLAAGVEQAVGIVAGTNDDHTNLSIVMTATELNPQLFVVMRQNRRANDALFQAVAADLVMQASSIIAHEMLAVLTEPLLARFLFLARKRDNAWANELLARISAVVDEVAPEIWEVEIFREEADGICHLLRDGVTVTAGDLLRDPRARHERLPALPLLLARGYEYTLLPEEGMEVELGDRWLFCGGSGGESAMAWTVRNYNVASYVLTGRDRPDGAVWRWLEARSGRG
ncbi:potassium channel family protein [Endothiovibrio diazotrophicus]